MYLDNKLTAAIVRDKNFSRWVGSPNHQTLTIAVDMHNKSTKQWLTKNLKQIFDSEADNIFRVVLSGNQSQLMTRLKKIGLQIKDYYLVGRTRSALQNLKRHIQNKNTRLPAHITLCDLSSQKQIDQIIMDYCLSENIQGKGIGSLITLQLLEAIRKNNIPIFTGYTSNPAIIRLGKITQSSMEQTFMIQGQSLNNLYLETDLGVVDFLNSNTGVGDFDRIRSQAEEIEIRGHKINVIT